MESHGPKIWVPIVVVVVVPSLYSLLLVELHQADGQRLEQLALELVEQVVPGQDLELLLAAVVGVA